MSDFYKLGFWMYEWSHVGPKRQTLYEGIKIGLRPATAGAAVWAGAAQSTISVVVTVGLLLLDGLWLYFQKSETRYLRRVPEVAVDAVDYPIAVTRMLVSGTLRKMTEGLKATAAGDGTREALRERCRACQETVLQIAANDLRGRYDLPRDADLWCSWLSVQPHGADKLAVTEVARQPPIMKGSPLQIVLDGIDGKEVKGPSAAVLHRRFEQIRRNSSRKLFKRLLPHDPDCVDVCYVPARVGEDVVGLMAVHSERVLRKRRYLDRWLFGYASLLGLFECMHESALGQDPRGSD